MERPLKEVPTKALYALHRGIEKRLGLSGVHFHNELGPANSSVCSLGATGDTHDMAVQACFDLELVCPNEGFPGALGAFNVAGSDVNFLNDMFVGTPEQRREFMLRHIVEELRQRGESLPVKKANVKYQEVK